MDSFGNATSAGAGANASVPTTGIVDLGAGRGQSAATQSLLRAVSPRRPAAFPAPAFGLATAPDAVR